MSGHRYCLFSILIIAFQSFEERITNVDADRQIRRDVLLELLAELHQRNITDAISVREWLEAKLREMDDEQRGTEHG